jgi:hypothetical protein
VGGRYLQWRNLSHKAMNAAQRRLFGALNDRVAAGTSENCLRAHAEIAYHVLRAGRATWVEAKLFVWMAYRDLRRNGITAPSRIPWYR